MDVLFRDPYPGLTDFSVSLPRGVKELTDSVDGTIGSLMMFTVAIKCECFRGSVEVEDDYVSLTLRNGKKTYHWTVIHFRDQEEPMNDNVYFHDPHPGMLGARAPIPYEVKELADAVDGKRGSLLEFVESIQAACPDGEITITDDYVGLTRKDGEMTHRWRVIRFDKPEDQADGPVDASDA